ncbi:hypothetical protein [Roseofilum casamattae]|uniref:Uncharacterized protein n=1 Tax=Roseofilum casamattae BLCC-M143 TaxID=3022442 RepID=A0ABT7BR67_9CYAN|nr:hypothetical protein [Roseofilum casamattae]MDJ1181697.1 hypothetical protein [Roseofilum casamattae BLCC-M143]
MNNRSDLAGNSKQTLGQSKVQAKDSWKRMQSLYQADQQVKYLHLEAEVECLLQQLQLTAQGKGLR